MKRILLLGTVACAVSLYSCKKDKEVIEKEKVVYPSGMINADSLTAGLSVGYASKVADSTFPAASTVAGAPKLDSLYSGAYFALRGGLLTIYPANVSGFVQGYYVQIVGAHAYFKIDYPAAEEKRKANARLAQQGPAGSRGRGEGFIDSTIAISLPAAIKGDTFYVKYAAYDKDNRVSQPVTAVVVIKDAISSSIVDSLKGTWRRLGYASYQYNQVGDYRIDTSGNGNMNYFNCVSDKLEYSDYTVTDIYIPSYKYTTNYGFTFNGNKLQQNGGGKNYILDLEKSSCSNYVYTYEDRTTVDDLMGYTFDPASRKLTVYYTNAEYSTYTISSLTSTELILRNVYTGDYGGGYFEKYIKQ